MKRCSKCGEVKPITAEFFYRRNSPKDGLHDQCKVCQSRYWRENRAEIRAQMPPKPDYTRAIKARAIVLSGILSIPEAAKLTGVEVSTIKNWRECIRLNSGGEDMKEITKGLVENRTYQGANTHIDPMIKEAIALALDEANAKIQERIDVIMHKYLELAEESTDEALNYLRSVGKLEKGQQTAAWLRAVVYAATQATSSNQLLRGKPTGRVEQDVRLTHKPDLKKLTEEELESLEQILGRATSGPSTD